MIDPTGLPIEETIGEIQLALETDRRVVIEAEPGAGKTTVVPLRLLAEPWLGPNKIVMLEPRRLAARGAARRLAQLLGERVGQTVGLVTRDERIVGPTTRVEVVTEGVLTRRLQRDPGLGDTGLVIFDEFHERSLAADTALALLLDAVRELDLGTAIAVMSATIDTETIAAYIGKAERPAPVVSAPGRTFPVEVLWRPRKNRQRIEEATADAVRWVTGMGGSGDLLVFLPGMGEIRRTEAALADVVGIDVRPLHGSLDYAEQEWALAPSDGSARKVVLSTDIAETSLTVEGITVVVDSGLARKPQFDPRTGMTRLLTVSTSRASADQRGGRAGRLGPGTGIRLWSKIENGTRPAFDSPEIATVDLAGFVLDLAQWGIRDPDNLPLLTPPPPRAWDESITLLRELDALDDDGGLTEIGAAMVEVPVHPRLARMIVGARFEGHGWLACLLAALLDERDLLRGKPDEVPADIATRLELLINSRRQHPSASGAAVRRVRDRAQQIADRVGIAESRVDIDHAGSILAWAYPDRIGQRRGDSRGRFRLRQGTGAWVSPQDPLAAAQLVVAADLDGKRSNARIRLGAPLGADDISARYHDQVTVTSGLVWDPARDDLRLKLERRLGSLDLGTFFESPLPGPDTTAALLDQVKRTKLGILTWTEGARGFQSRAELVRTHPDSPVADKDSWPDVSDRRLRRDVGEWLEPFLPGATSRADLETVSVLVALHSLFTPDQLATIERLAPESLPMPSGVMRIDYGHIPPVLRAKAQRLYGITEHPAVLDGRLPLQVEVLSPADRPVQVTSDLPGFWAGSWAAVRKDMAGRYPKHDWPEDPARPGEG